MDNNQSFRVHTDIGQDKKLDIHLQQNVGLLQILSLNLKQSDAYINKSSNYGIIVGRVLANDAFGVENVKVSVFIPVTDDYFITRIRSVYPYRDILRRNGINNHRYNLLEDEVADECHADVGTFPNKRLVLDDNTYIEVFDKYYKYTTVTNKAGDYMIYGVPTGNQQVHIDLDLSNIGILSQKPRDFYYKGYGPELFKNAEQFKTSSNLDNLVQIISQNKTIDVYPFWGDDQNDTVAITRCDINIDYQFESTCVFMGSVMTDGEDNAMGNRCLPARYVGKNKKLIAGEGTIEMIRKTQDGYVEEYNLKGGRLIDADGVWCYQIPMNLDYIQTDEEGNIIPSQDPAKGIATRARVRFRMSIDDMAGDGKSKHRAKYLVPNNPIVYDDESSETGINVGLKYDGADLNNQYIYGSETQDSDFRDLQWNKVYTVKSFIPRIVNGASKKHFLPKFRENNRAFLGIKSSNNAEPNNPFPYNSFMGTISFSFKIICNIINILLDIIYEINQLLNVICNIAAVTIAFSTFGIMAKKAKSLMATKCVTFSFDNYVFIVGCESKHLKATQDAKKCNEKDINCIYTNSQAMQLVQQHLAEEFDVIDLDFSNDWVNGVLYFPMWHWLKKKKKKFFWGLFSRKAVDRFCNCDTGSANALQYHYVHAYDNINKTNAFSNARLDNNITYSMQLPSGIIKQYFNKDNVDIYYYAPAVIGVDGVRAGSLTNTSLKKSNMLRLFATDIVLLGSLMDDDLDGVGKLFRALPQTSANIPPLAQELELDSDTTTIDTANGLDIPYGTPLVSGLDEASQQSGDGTFFGLTCNSLYPMSHGLINAQRICELGVSADETHYYPIKRNGFIEYGLSKTDAMITKIEMYDPDSRAEFATYNSNPLLVSKLNKQTGYKTYNYEFKYPLNFDGTMAGKSLLMTTEGKSKSYTDFRYGKYKHFYKVADSAYVCPIFNNSFYFYFGLKAGKTAIDKFRSTFYVDCVKDESLSFPIGITVLNTGKSCRKADSDFPAFKVNLTSASKPYEVYIKDEEGNEVFRLQNGNQDKFTLYRYFYLDETYGKLIRGGEVDGSYEDGGNELMPQIYTVYVQDSMGKISNNKVNLQIQQLAPVNVVHAFKKKSNELSGIDYDNSGNFFIDQISIDGSEPYEVTNIQQSTVTSAMIDNWNDISENIIDYQIVDMTYTNENGETVIDTFIVYQVEQFDFTIQFHNGVWYVDKPADVNLLIAKLCPLATDNKHFYCLNDFVGNIGATINEYQPYILTLNGVEIEGWVTDGSKDGNSNERLDKNLLQYWKPTSYNWYNKPIATKSYWEDVIDNYTDFASDTEKAIAICAYKFNSMFDICNILYPASNTTNNVPVGFNCKGMESFTNRYGTMYPFAGNGDEQAVNSMKSYSYGSINNIAIDGTMPIYCNPYSYVSTFNQEFTQYFFTETGAGVTLESEELALEGANRMFLGNLTANKNYLYNGYKQTFGFYNCMAYCTTVIDGTETLQAQAPPLAEYKQHTIGEYENGSWVKNWLSFNTFENRLGSVAFLYQTPKDDVSADNLLFGTIVGGVYLATDENHNVISAVKDGETPDTSYSFNPDELTAGNPQVYVNTGVNRTLYQLDIEDSLSNVIKLEHSPVTGDLIEEKRFVRINPEMNVIQTTGDLKYTITNNSWDITLDSNIVLNEDYPANNLIELSGVVQEGNSFSTNVEDCVNGKYKVGYGTLGNQENYLTGLSLAGELPYSIGNIEINPINNTIVAVRMCIENNQNENGTIYCCSMNGGASEFVRILKNTYNSYADENKLRTDEVLGSTLYLIKKKGDVIYRTSRDVISLYTRTTGGDILRFTSGQLDLDDSKTYFEVPKKGFDPDAKEIYPANTEFPLVVIERKYDSNWDKNHNINELYVISEVKVKYVLPFESSNGFKLKVKSGYSYYYKSSEDLTYKEIKPVDGYVSLDGITDIISYKGNKVRDIIAKNDTTEEYCRIQFSY